jgi:endoglucanase
VATNTAANPTSPLQTRGAEFIDAAGNPIRLRGVCIGGWLNMENFITGYSANESMMRAKVKDVLGPEKYDRFFDRLLSAFYDEADIEFLAENGFNAVRIPINYRHLEDDDRPFEILEEGFRFLDRAIEQGGRHGVYSVIDLHAVPGSQNQHWHSDNPTHVAAFWQHPHFQERAVNIWQAIAKRYRGNPWVAGYNLLNEPADESRAVVGPFYERVVAAIREIDADHIIYIDGNTFSTEFDIFDTPWETNTVYTLHDYVAAGLGRGGPYPGLTDGVWFDKEVARKKFLQRAEYAIKTKTPIMVGEFAPIYVNDERVDVQRRQILADQLETYVEYNVSWSSWMYKDLGRQGVVYVKPDSPYRKRFDDFVAKKNRLGADQWGSTGEGVKEVTQPVQDLIATEFPNFNPYPWGRFDWVRTLLLNITIAQPLAEEYAELFRGLDDEELDALADSFRFENCAIREPLLEQLKKG